MASNEKELEATRCEIISDIKGYQVITTTDDGEIVTTSKWLPRRGDAGSLKQQLDQAFARALRNVTRGKHETR